MATQYNHFSRIALMLPEIAQALVKEACFNIQANAQANCPVGETGFLRSSIYSVFPTGSTYGMGFNGKGEPLPEVHGNFEPGQVGGIVAVAAHYGAFVEFGTRYMAPRPFLIPAEERERPIFNEKFRRIEAHLHARGL